MYSPLIVGALPLLKGGRTFQKLSHLVGGIKFFARKGDKPEKGADAEMGGGSCHIFYYFTVQSYLLCVWEK